MVRLRDAQTRNIQVNVHYKSLEAYRSVRIDNRSEIKYAFSIYLGEAISSFGENSYLPFMVDVETNPEVAAFKIKGEIFVKGPPQIVKGWVVSENNEPPKIWFQVYREVLKTLSSLAGYIQVPPPDGPSKEFEG